MLSFLIKAIIKAIFYCVSMPIAGAQARRTEARETVTFTGGLCVEVYLLVALSWKG